MRKIVFLFLTLFTFMNNVKATEWQEDKLEGNNIETEYRYQFYKEEQEGEYLEIGKESDYQYEDKNNIIYSDYSDYKTSCPNGEAYENIYKTKYVYSEILPVKYIRITNYSQVELDIANIEPLENNTLLTYEIYRCFNCINDNNTIDYNGGMIIELEKEVKLKDLTFILEFSDTGNSIDYSLIYSNNSDFSTTGLVAYKESKNHISYNVYNDFFLYNNYTEAYTDYDIEINDLVHVISEEKVCKTRTKMSYHYNNVKKYYDNNYYKDVSELKGLSEEEQKVYQKDLENYKIYYRYKDESVDDKTHIETDDTDNLKLVKTGVEKKLNYNYLIMYVLTLILIALILIKNIKKMSNEKDN